MRTYSGDQENEREFERISSLVAAKKAPFLAPKTSNSTTFQAGPSRLRKSTRDIVL
jgi:hypothetical protein